MRKLIATLSVVALLAGIVAYAALAATPKVSWHIGTNKTVKIRKGQKVTWVWAGDAKHNVKGKGFKSPAKSRKGYTYSHVFRTKGKFTITCTFHPGIMKTVVKVG
jgi:plastocyanin